MMYHVTERHFTPHLKPPLGTLETCSACELTTLGKELFGLKRGNSFIHGHLMLMTNYDFRSGGFFFVGKVGLEFNKTS